MNRSLKILGAASAAIFVFSLSAHATTYAGNGNNGFNGAGIGPVGGASLTLTSSGGMLSGSITPGANNGAGNNGQLYDELVIYISTNGTTGVTSTLSLTNTTAVNATLAKAVSGYDGSLRATINFAAGFAANYAIAISPSQAGLGELYSISSAGVLTGLTSINLSPTTGAGNPNYTFSFTLASIGSPANFKFSSSYINAHNDIYRSNEAFNTITDPSANITGANNPGRDTVSLGTNTFVTGLVPEPSTWAMMLGGVGMLFGFQRRLRRQA